MEHANSSSAPPPHTVTHGSRQLRLSAQRALTRASSALPDRMPDRCEAASPNNGCAQRLVSAMGVDLTGIVPKGQRCEYRGAPAPAHQPEGRHLECKLTSGARLSADAPQPLMVESFMGWVSRQAS